MKKLITCLLIGAFAGSASFADEEEGRKSRPDGRKAPPAILKKFDADGDGKLNEAERAKVREEFAKRIGRPGGSPNREEMLKKFDKNEDGKLDDEERKALRDSLRKAFLEKYDKDGDGKLSPEERKVAGEAMRKERGGPARPPREGRPSGRGGAGLPKEILEKYDADGDGRLSKIESEKARDELGDKFSTRPERVRRPAGDKKPNPRRKRGDGDGEDRE